MRVFHGWWIVGVAMLTQAVATGLAIYSYGLLVLPVSTELGASRMEMMWGKTGLSLMTILVSPFLGALLDRRSTRVLMVLGALALGSAFALLSVSRTPWEFAIAFAILPALAMAFLGPLGTSALVTRWFTARRGRALSLAALGSSIGGLLIPLFFQALIDAHGWRLACLWTGIAIVVLLVPVIVAWVRNWPAELALHPDGAATTGAYAAQPMPAPMERLLRSGLFWRIAITIGTVFAANAALLVNLVPFAQGQGIVSKQAALLVSMYAISGIGGKLLFGLIADRIDLKTALATVMALQAPPILVLGMTGDFQVMVICAAILGVASGGLMPGWTALLARIYGPIHYGRVLGRMLPVAGIMSTLIIPSIGFLFDLSGDYVMAFMILAALVILATMWLVPLRQGVCLAPEGMGR